MTNKTIKVMVIDDSTQRAQGWAEKLRNLSVTGLKVEAPDNRAVVQIVRSLNQRRQKARKKENWRNEACAVDDVDVLLIDFDLINLAEDHAESATGESIAYLARVVSSANIICVVNQFGTNRFDLTMTADLTKRNDLDISSSQLTNPGLWKGVDSWRGFRPWHWPVLTKEVDLYLKRTKDVRRNPNMGVHEFFGFDPSGKNPPRTLPKAALSYFQHSSKKMTFRSILSTSAFVDPKDSVWLRRDADQSARVAAAVVHRWLERWVLARQDILVDIPHLIARKPWLLKNPENKEAWNKTTGPGAPKMLIPALQKFRFVREHWLSRPAYWSEDINSNPKLAFPNEGWSYKGIPSLVFREDLSDFGNRDDSLEFDCQFGSSYDLRYVCDPNRTKGFKGMLDPGAVEYTPATRLAM